MAKKGEKCKHDECGLVVVVEDHRGCETAELICCEAPMKPVKAALQTKKTKKAKKIKKG